jgi:hypothetical protein
MDENALALDQAKLRILLLLYWLSANMSSHEVFHNTYGELTKGEGHVARVTANLGKDSTESHEVPSNLGLESLVIDTLGEAEYTLLATLIGEQRTCVNLLGHKDTGTRRVERLGVNLVTVTRSVG